MVKIVLIGAGSHFGIRLSLDVLASDAFDGVHIALCDINEERLAKVHGAVKRAIEGHGLNATVSASTDRHELLPGADVVVTSVSIGGGAYFGEPYASEVGIPLQYGISQTVADTIGPGGVFRFLRTGPTHLQFCLDMEQHCPDALLLNYTNPMCMLTWLHSVGSSIRNVGLCHSVQGTTKQIANWLKIPYDEVSYLVAGINHQAWLLKYRHKGEDMYPRMMAEAPTNEGFQKDSVRTEMMQHFGYFVTESTRHNSEYLPYFRHDREQSESYGIPWEREVRMDAPVRPMWAGDTGAVEGEEGIPPLTRSHEYASRIVEAFMTNEPFVFNGNVMNNGLITNLPAVCCVEVPVVVDSEGFHACHIGALPSQCAALNRTNVNVQELAVEAVLHKDREAAYHAVALDPLTAAILPLKQIRAMFEEMWAAEGDRLDYYNSCAAGRGSAVAPVTAEPHPTTSALAGLRQFGGPNRLGDQRGLDDRLGQGWEWRFKPAGRAFGEVAEQPGQGRRGALGAGVDPREVDRLVLDHHAEMTDRPVRIEHHQNHTQTVERDGHAAPPGPQQRQFARAQVQDGVLSRLRAGAQVAP